MSTVVYSYSSNSFSQSTLLSVNPLNGQLEPLDYRSPDYRIHESSFPTKWGTLSNISIDDNSDSGLGSSEEFSDAVSATSDLFNTGFYEECDEFSDSVFGNELNTAFYEDSCDSSYSEFDISSQLNTAFCQESDDFSDTESTASDCFNTAFSEEPATPPTTSYLARFRPESLRNSQIVSSIDEDLLDSISFFTLTRPLDSPQEWSEEERMEFMCMQMRLLWNVNE